MLLEVHKKSLEDKLAISKKVKEAQLEVQKQLEKSKERWVAVYDPQAEKFYYGKRPDGVQIVGDTQHRPPALEHRKQVSNGPGPGAWQRGGRGNTTNVRNAEVARMHLWPTTEGEWGRGVDEDARGSLGRQLNTTSSHSVFHDELRQPNTMSSRSVFRDGLDSSAVNSRQITKNKGTVKG